MAKDRKRDKEMKAQRAATARRNAAGPDSLVIEANDILTDLAAQDENYRLSYYVVDPRWLSDDPLADVPFDGRLHEQASVMGRELQLPETHRRKTIREASRGFTGPFVAVLRNPETADEPVGSAVIISGANLVSAMLRAPLEMLMRARRLDRLDFGALLAMPSAPGEWAASSKDEVTTIIERFQLRVEAEAVLEAAPFLPKND